MTGELCRRRCPLASYIVGQLQTTPEVNWDHLTDILGCIPSHEDLADIHYDLGSPTSLPPRLNQLFKDIINIRHHQHDQMMHVMATTPRSRTEIIRTCTASLLRQIQSLRDRTDFSNMDVRTQTQLLTTINRGVRDYLKKHRRRTQGKTCPLSRERAAFTHVLQTFNNSTKELRLLYKTLVSMGVSPVQGRFIYDVIHQRLTSIDTSKLAHFNNTIAHMSPMDTFHLFVDTQRGTLGMLTTDPVLGKQLSPFHTGMETDLPDAVTCLTSAQERPQTLHDLPILQRSSAVVLTNDQRVAIDVMLLNQISIHTMDAWGKVVTTLTACHHTMDAHPDICVTILGDESRFMFLQENQRLFRDHHMERITVTTMTTFSSTLTRSTQQHTILVIDAVHGVIPIDTITHQDVRTYHKVIILLSPATMTWTDTRSVLALLHTVGDNVNVLLNGRCSYNIPESTGGQNMVDEGIVWSKMTQSDTHQATTLRTKVDMVIHHMASMGDLDESVGGNGGRLRYVVHSDVGEDGVRFMCELLTLHGIDCDAYTHYTTSTDRRAMVDKFHSHTERDPYVVIINHLCPILRSTVLGTWRFIVTDPLWAGRSPQMVLDHVLPSTTHSPAVCGTVYYHRMLVEHVQPGVGDDRVLYDTTVACRDKLQEFFRLMSTIAQRNTAHIYETYSMVDNSTTIDESDIMMDILRGMDADAPHTNKRSCSSQRSQKTKKRVKKRNKTTPSP